ncbi:MAG: hypothetical protein WB816_08755, partial [Methylocystis sp.]
RHDAGSNRKNQAAPSPMPRSRRLRILNPIRAAPGSPIFRDALIPTPAPRSLAAASASEFIFDFDALKCACVRAGAPNMR